MLVLFQQIFARNVIIKLQILYQFVPPNKYYSTRPLVKDL